MHGSYRQTYKGNIRTRHIGLCALGVASRQTSYHSILLAGCRVTLNHGSEGFDNGGIAFHSRMMQ